MSKLNPFGMETPIKLNPADVNSCWCVYYHRIDGVTVFIGVCRLSEVFNSPDARRNVDWIKQASNREIELIIIGIAPDRTTAHNEAHKLIMQFRPTWNIGGSRLPRHFKIVCNETGQVFQSMSEAAINHGTTQPTISNHLAGRKGYEKIAGHFTFKRIL